jgi:hypothetical protein
MSDWKDLYKKNVFELNDKDLETYIEELKKMRLEKLNCNSISATECNILLQIASNQRNNLLSSRMGKLAIYISLIGVIIALIN